MKVLVLGGYGVFGGRLAELVADFPELTVLIAGRSLAKASLFCKGLDSAATFTPLEVDRSAVSSALTEHQPDILVDASGPFQSYGDDPYSVAKACIATGTHYLDFADAADFVFGISALNEQARKAGVVVLAGVSSFPVLTASVVQELSKGIEIKSVKGGIAPSPYAGVGMNVMRAVVGYAGGSVKLIRDGKKTTARGLAESLRYTISPPGKMPIRSIHFSLVDVPDLQLLPMAYPSIENIWMGAGPTPEFLHRILNVLAKSRAMLRLPSLGFLAPLCYWMLNLVKYGEHRGGMFVEVTGEKEGQPIIRSWHLLAEGDDGPYIPSMAIETLLRKWVDGDLPTIGARAATNALDLSDFERAFGSHAISFGFRSTDGEQASLYEKSLGSAFADLPAQVQALHGSKEKRQWRGRSKVSRGKGFLARVIATIIGFPPENEATSVTVTFTPNEEGELWERNFGGRKFRSFQALGAGRNQHLLTERFGLITVGLALVAQDQRLYLIPRRWSILGLPLPTFLLPKGESFEEEQNGKFSFNVRIEAPIVGLIVAYKGELSEAAPL